MMPTTPETPLLVVCDPYRPYVRLGQDVRAGVRTDNCRF